MSKEEARMKLYRLNSSNRKVRSAMMRTLKLTRKGQFEEAGKLLEQSKKELEEMKQEHNTIAQHSGSRHVQDAQQSLEYTDILHETISLANRLQSKNCSAIKFHLYN